MRLEECSICGKEYDVRDMFETLNADDEYTCQACMKKLEENGKLGGTKHFADISEVPLSTDDDSEDEG